MKILRVDSSYFMAKHILNTPWINFTLNPIHHNTNTFP